MMKSLLSRLDAFPMSQSRTCRSSIRVLSRIRELFMQKIHLLLSRICQLKREDTESMEKTSMILTTKTSVSDEQEQDSLTFGASGISTRMSMAWTSLSRDTRSISFPRFRGSCRAVAFSVPVLASFPSPRLSRTYTVQP